MKLTWIFIFTIALAATGCQPKPKAEKKGVYKTEDARKNPNSTKSQLEAIKKMAFTKVPYKLTLLNDCDEGASHEQVQSHAKMEPFDVELNASDSNVIVDFSFIDDCCKRFKGSAMIKSDTLFLITKNKNMEVCECHCEYRHRFRVRIPKERYSFIKLNKSLLEQQ